MSPVLCLFNCCAVFNWLCYGQEQSCSLLYLCSLQPYVDAWNPLRSLCSPRTSLLYAQICQQSVCGYCVVTVPVKSMDTPTHSRVVVNVLLFSQLQNNSEDIKTMKQHIWNHVVIKTVIYFIFQILQSSHLLPKLHCWHSLIQLHEVVTWNTYQLTGVPC